MLTTYCGHSMYCLTILYVYAPRFCGQREGHVEIMENMDSQLDSDLWKSFFLGQDSLSNKENNKTTKQTFVQDSPCFKYY